MKEIIEIVEEVQELQKKKIEHQRWLNHQRWLDYQSRLSNAPKKPVYKPVSSMQCPFCLGHREVDEIQGEIKCPYCGSSEQLVVDHYEIDHDSFRQQLQQEQELQKKKNSYEALIALFSVLSALSLIILIFFPLVGIFFFAPSCSMLIISIKKRLSIKK